MKFLKLTFLLIFLTALHFKDSFQRDVHILHWNDWRGLIDKFKIDPSTGYPVPCKNDIDDQCEYKGIVGLGGLIKKLEDEEYLTGVKLRISTGNLVGGTWGWISANSEGWKNYGGLIQHNSQHFDISPNYAALGLKEFEAGLRTTNQYITQWAPNSPISDRKIIMTNLDMDQNYTGDATAFTQRIVTFKDETFKESADPLRILGFIDPLVEDLSSPGALKFNDIVDSLKKALVGYRGDAIAIGSGNLDIAKSIISNIPQIRIVIYSGGNSDLKDYPTKHGDGWIFKAGMYGTCLGQISFEMSENGDNKIKDLLPITTCHQINMTSPDGTNSEGLRAIKASAEQLMERIATSKFKLSWTQKTCWESECNLGNLITDSMVHCGYTVDEDFKDILHSVWHSGAIFGAVEHHADTKNISELDVHAWLPYHNRPVTLMLTGQKIWELFGISATALNPNGQKWGQFLQVSSGMEITYIKTRSGNYEVGNIRMNHLEDSIPKMQDVPKDDSFSYTIVLPSFLAQGKSMYSFLKDLNQTPRPLASKFDDDCVIDYIRARDIIFNGFEERIHIRENSNPNPPPPPEKKCSKGQNVAVTVTLTLVFFILIVGLIFVGYRYVWPLFRRPHRSSFP